MRRGSSCRFGSSGSTADRVLLTNMVGEHLFVSVGRARAIVEKAAAASSPLVRQLRSKHIIREPARSSRSSCWR